MQLPSRLRSSTLGDLLGQLHRERVSGLLRLREARGATAGRAHNVYLRQGLVIAVEGAGTTTEPGALPEEMSRELVRERLDELYRLDDAEITFHVTQRAREVLPAPLEPTEFLHGRPRSRDRESENPAASGSVPAVRRRALATLGLPLSASSIEVHRAFKLLAIRVHPDRYPHADPHEKQALSAHFARLAQAYHSLLA